MPLFSPKHQHTLTPRDLSAPLPIQHAPSPTRPPSTDPPPLPVFIDYARYTFAPTTLPSGPANGDGEDDGYGCMKGVGKGVRLGLKDVGEVVRDVADQTNNRGLATPLLFSNQALDLSPAKIRLFIQSYIGTLSPRQASAQSLTAYGQNLQLCQPYELAWFLRWALGRVVRLVREEHWGSGTARGNVVDVREREVRGLVDWADYEIWRRKERAKNYPETFVNSFFAVFPSELCSLLQALFTLLSRLTAYFHISGLTPVTLASLFGPLLFGLEDSSFAETHAAYIRAAGATEHLLLAFIRSQAAAHDRLKGDFPRTLREWIQGYPSASGIIITDRELDLGLPRKGVRTVRVHSMQRNARSYSRDLIRSHADWIVGYEAQLGRKWTAWENVIGANVAQDSGLWPNVTETHRLRLRLKSTTITHSARPSPKSKVELSNYVVDSIVDGNAVAGEDEWCLFEDSGFEGSEDFRERLRFDLNEGAKQQVNLKRITMDWADFSSPSGGFDRMPSALANSLAISQPLVREHLRHWPAEREELRRKLRKGHKELPSFDAYDYRFRVPDEGTENEGAMWIEEPFLDVWADLLMGGGWMDTDELTYRPANWVILEYQQRPATMSGTKSTSAIFVFQEFVPLQYQDALQHPKSKRLDFFKRFPRHSGPADHTVKQTSSDGGKETVFDAQLRKGNYTKVVSLSKPTSSSSIGSPPPSTPHTPERHRQYRSFDTRVSPSDSSPTSRDTSVSFLNRLNKASPKRTSIQGGAQDNCTSSQVRKMVADSGDCTRYPTKGAVSTELHDSDRDMWIGVLAVNGARAITVQASPLVTKNASHLSSPGFCVVSRCDPMTNLDLPSLQTPTKPDITPYGSLVHYPSMLPAGTFRLVSGAGSPSPTLSFEISTKPSSDTLPEPDAAKRELTEIGPDHIRLVRPARVFHQVLHHDGKSTHSMAAYVNNDSSRSTEFLEKDTERNNSTNTVISTRPFAQAAPVHLERPLPLPPTYGSLSGNRDTVFSVNDGYATNGCDTTSRVRGHDLGGGRETSSGIFTATPLPTVKYDWDCPSAVKQSPNSRYSVYSNADPDAIYHSKDRRDSSGTPDSEEDHCDAVAVVTDLHDCESELDSGELEPPNLAIIEAIARQPSPGRYGHGIPLAFVHEEPEIESDGSDGHYITATSMPQSMTGTRTGHFQ